MVESSNPQNLSVAYRVKSSVVQTSLLALATAFEIVSRHSKELKAELADWEEGRTFSMGVMNDGPAVTMRKDGLTVRYVGKGHIGSSLKILFKNMDSALLPLTGQMGSHTAFVQHRAILHGSIGQAMQVNRAMDIVQKFLMPGIVLKWNNKRPPEYKAADRLLKARVMGMLGLGLLTNMRK